MSVCLTKLRLGFLLINDWAGADLREESREEQKLEVAAGQSLASAAAHEPGDLHEGDERNPQRQQDFFNKEIGFEDGVEIRDEKIRVFEIAKDENIQAHREHEEPFSTRFAATLECRAQQVVDRRERQKQCQHRGVSPGIKNQRSRQQPCLAGEEIPEAFQQEKPCKHDREESEKEGGGVEKHSFRTSPRAL